MAGHDETVNKATFDRLIGRCHAPEAGRQSGPNKRLRWAV